MIFRTVSKTIYRALENGKRWEIDKREGRFSPLEQEFVGALENKEAVDVIEALRSGDLKSAEKLIEKYRRRKVNEIKIGDVLFFTERDSLYYKGHHSSNIDYIGREGILGESKS